MKDYIGSNFQDQAVVAAQFGHLGIFFFDLFSPSFSSFLNSLSHLHVYRLSKVFA